MQVSKTFKVTLSKADVVNAVRAYFGADSLEAAAMPSEMSRITLKGDSTAISLSYSKEV